LSNKQFRRQDTKKTERGWNWYDSKQPYWVPRASTPFSINRKDFVNDNIYIFDNYDIFYDKVWCCCIPRRCSWHSIRLFRIISIPTTFRLFRVLTSELLVRQLPVSTIFQNIFWLIYKSSFIIWTLFFLIDKLVLYDL
jgi:hypothetical protein